MLPAPAKDTPPYMEVASRGVRNPAEKRAESSSWRHMALVAHLVVARFGARWAFHPTWHCWPSDQRLGADETRSRNGRLGRALRKSACFTQRHGDRGSR